MAEAREVVVMKAGVRPPEAADLAPHPGTFHEFRTICLGCGEPGFLHVAVITPDERVEVHEAPNASEGEPK